MKIQQMTKLRPFSHTPNATCLIPYSSWKVQAFPTKFIFQDVLTSEKIECNLHMQGPVKEFTVQQDLEKGVVLVFGKAHQGYFRVSLGQSVEGLKLSIEKSFPEGMKIEFLGKELVFQTSDHLQLSSKVFHPCSHLQERLYLGVNKEQDWSGIRQRANLSEILPIWLRLGQMCPGFYQQESKGMFALIEEVRRCFSYPNQKMVSSLQALFLAGFYSMLCPRLFDNEYQGLVREEGSEGSELDLLVTSSILIRKMFFIEEQSHWTFLSSPSKEWVCGSFFHVLTKDQDRIDFSWSKSKIRTVTITPGISKEIHLIFPKEISRFRLRKSLNEKGCYKEIDALIHLELGTVLYLDRFE